MSRLFIQPSDRGQLFIAAKLCTLDRTLEYANGLVIDACRNGKRMSILAAVSEGIAGRIIETAGSAVYDFRDERQSQHGTGPHLGREQQFSKVFWAIFCRCRKITVQAAHDDIGAANVMMIGHLQMG